MTQYTCTDQVETMPNITDCPPARDSFSHPVWKVTLVCQGEEGFALKSPSGCKKINQESQLDRWIFRSWDGVDTCTWVWISSQEYTWPQCIGKDKPSSWPDYSECPCELSGSSVHESEESFSSGQFQDEAPRCYTTIEYDMVFQQWSHTIDGLEWFCYEQQENEPEGEWIFADSTDEVCKWYRWGNLCELESKSSTSPPSSSDPDFWDLDAVTLAHYKLNDNEPNTTIVNSKGTNGDANVNTNTISVDGVINKALDFNSANGNLNQTFQTMMRSGFSVAYWVKPHDLTDFKRHILFGSNAGAPEDVFQIGSKNDQMFLSYGIGGIGYTSTVPTPTGVFEVNRWNHVVANLRYPDVYEVWIDGQLLWEAVGGLPIDQSTWATSNNAQFTPNQDTVLDDVRFHSRILTQPEIRALAKGTEDTAGYKATSDVFLCAEKFPASSGDASSGEDVVGFPELDTCFGECRIPEPEGIPYDATPGADQHYRWSVYEYSGAGCTGIIMNHYDCVIGRPFFRNQPCPYCAPISSPVEGGPKSTAWVRRQGPFDGYSWPFPECTGSYPPDCGPESSS